MTVYELEPVIADKVKEWLAELGIAADLDHLGRDLVIHAQVPSEGGSDHLVIHIGRGRRRFSATAGGLIASDTVQSRLAQATVRVNLQGIQYRSEGSKELAPEE